MKYTAMMGWSLIRTSELVELKKSHHQIGRLMYVHRWFAGWRDLDIIWDYILSDTYFGGIERARKDYAFARNTTEYGVELKKGNTTP